MRIAEAAQRAGEAIAADYGMTAAEYKYRALVRKSLVAARDLSAGETLTHSDVTLKRSPRAEAMPWIPADVAGRVLSSDVAEGEPIHDGVLTASHL
jgi:sialic acid synthase SpsE